MSELKRARKRTPPLIRFERFVMPEPNTGCWLWLGYCDKDGYGHFSVDRSVAPVGAHRVSYEFYRGPVPRHLLVLHKCDVPACVNPDHLFVGTQKKNIADMYRKGRGPRRKGEMNPRARLSDEDIRAIRLSAENQNALARRFGVTQSNISRIKSMKNWTHV